MHNKVKSIKDVGRGGSIKVTKAVVNRQGVMLDPNPSAVQGEWKWMPGIGFITAGKYSAYLIFSSAYAPVKGSFTVKTPEESDEGIPGEVPEPSILALLGIASARSGGRNARRGKIEHAWLVGGISRG